MLGGRDCIFSGANYCSINRVINRQNGGFWRWVGMGGSGGFSRRTHRFPGSGLPVRPRRRAAGVVGRVRTHGLVTVGVPREPQAVRHVKVGLERAVHVVVHAAAHAVHGVPRAVALAQQIVPQAVSAHAPGPPRLGLGLGRRRRRGDGIGLGRRGLGGGGYRRRRGRQTGGDHEQRDGQQQLAVMMPVTAVVADDGRHHRGCDVNARTRFASHWPEYRTARPTGPPVAVAARRWKTHGERGETKKIPPVSHAGLTRWPRFAARRARFDFFFRAWGSLPSKGFYYLIMYRNN